MTIVDDQDSLLQFIYKVDGFHDAILHEMLFIHKGYVENDGKLFGDCELPDAKLLFQSQMNDIPAIMVLLKDIKKFRYNPSFDFKLEGEYSSDGIYLYPCGRSHQAESLIIAKEIEYDILDNKYRGAQLHDLIST